MDTDRLLKNFVADTKAHAAREVAKHRAMPTHVYLLWLNETVLSVHPFEEQAIQAASDVMFSPEFTREQWAMAAKTETGYRWSCRSVARLEIERKMVK
jgi:hypothetical protein